jgi:hypothetical protein
LKGERRVRTKRPRTYILVEGYQPLAKLLAPATYDAGADVSARETALWPDPEENETHYERS